ncbi:MAG: nucleotidyltransferase domain-containing protein [Cytophagales bacterium]|nr:nucleotidyltransferase domain-containing protein [Cytophagales bacterium]
MVKKSILKIVKNYLSYLEEEKYNIEKAFLFGSYVNGDFHKDSDIDIAIVMKNLSDSFDMRIELMKLRRNIDLRIEPHPFDEKEFNDNDPLAYQIITTGIEVK